MPDPSLWGAPFWATVHYVALGYPSDQPPPAVQASYRSFYRALGHVLPCSACSANYKRHVRDLPPEPALQEGREALFEWTVAMHNMVNVEQGRPEWSVDHARRHWTHGGWRDTMSCTGGALGQRQTALALIGSNVVLVLALAVALAWCFMRSRPSSA